MTLVAGVDCSTQATKVVVCEAATGKVVRTGQSSHPGATEVDPGAWWAAWLEASAGILDGVDALAVGAQQHGLVLTDTADEPVRPALLWNDNRSAPQARALVDELGGPAAWAEATGVVPVASITVSKLRWVAEHEPEVAARASHALLPHDYLTHRLRAEGEPTTDRGDASGTGYWSPTAGYRDDLLRRAFGRELATPRVAGPSEVVGATREGIALGPGTGDNMAAALALDLAPGDVVVSLGTSGTVFAVVDHPTVDADGIVAGFADARGGFLPLVCTLNAARVLDSVAAVAGVAIQDIDQLALSVDGSDGLVLLPFLDGERTPALPDAHGVLAGITRHNLTRGHLVRAGMEGMLCGLGDAVDTLCRHGVTPRRILLIGGAARSAAVQRIAAGLFGLPVDVPEPGQYVALGAARQAAWALSGGDEPPAWPVAAHRVEPAGSPAAWVDIRERYREVLHRAGPLLAEGGP